MAKRKREEDNTTSEPALIKIEYANLPTESRHRLDQAFEEWKAWHADRFPPGYSPSEVVSGTLRYEPNGPVATLPPTALPVVDDRPAAPAVPLTHTLWFNVRYERTGDVPSYERAVDYPLEAAAAKGTRAKTSKIMRTPSAPAKLINNADGEANLEEESDVIPFPGVDAADAAGAGAGAGTTPRTAAPPAKRPRKGQQCFNCGSYAHSLRDCWKEHDASAVAEARRAMGSKKPSFTPKQRYFTEEPKSKKKRSSGNTKNGEDLAENGQEQANADEEEEEEDSEEEDDLTEVELLQREFLDAVPGALSDNLREALGIDDFDPPPWLHAMRALGVPPAYKAVLPGSPERSFPGEGPPEEVERNAATGERQGKIPPEGATATAATTASNGGNDNGFKSYDPSGSGKPMLVVLEDKGGRQSRLEEGELPGTASEEDQHENLTNRGNRTSAAAATGEEGEGERVLNDDVDAKKKDEDLLEDFIPLPEKYANKEGGDDQGNGRKDRKSDLPRDEVIFPGVNAPIPEGADPMRWTHHQHHHYPQPQRAQQRWNSPLLGLHKQPSLPQPMISHAHTHAHAHVQSYGQQVQPPAPAAAVPRPMKQYNPYEAQQHNAPVPPSTAVPPPPIPSPAAAAPLPQEYHYDRSYSMQQAPPKPSPPQPYPPQQHQHQGYYQTSGAEQVSATVAAPPPPPPPPAVAAAAVDYGQQYHQPHQQQQQDYYQPQYGEHQWYPPQPPQQHEYYPPPSTGSAGGYPPSSSPPMNQAGAPPPPLPPQQGSYYNAPPAVPPQPQYQPQYQQQHQQYHQQPYQQAYQPPPPAPPSGGGWQQPPPPPPAW